MKQDSLFPLEHASWPAFLADEAGTLRRANSAALALFGPVMEGATSLLAAIWGPDNEASAELFLARLARAPAPAAKLNLRLKGGGFASFSAHVCAIPGEGQKLFLFQLSKTETPSPKSPPAPPAEPVASAHKQKLDCALQMARTVALDFNNALTIILGHVSLILSRIAPDHPFRTPLLEVEKSAERAAEIAQDLAAFSRQEKDARTQIAGNLNDVLRRIAEVFQSTASRNLTFSLHLQPRLNAVTFDEAKMQQALVKILDNAVQALGGQGQVDIHTRNGSFTEPFADGAVRIAPGTYVCVEIADNGPGIPADIMPRIFEPFFTTKPNHRGLGLAWVYGIVTNHGGSVAVSNVPTGGTAVRVYLPAHPRALREAPPNTDHLRGNQTILLVDDEELMLTMGHTVLTAYGYRVLTANNGPRALDLFRAHPDAIDLVVTDMVMPHMSGRELIEQLRRHHPAVRILCTSGYVRPAPSDPDLYLQKPFTSQDLVRKVRQALEKAE